MKLFINFTLLLILTSCIGKNDHDARSVNKNTENIKSSLENQTSDHIRETESIDLNKQAEEAKQFCINNKMNTDFTLLIDMSKHSGKARFYIYDFKLKSVIDSGLVSHGCCSNPWGADGTKTNPTFNNIPESHCSSLGKYKVGKRGWSNWGIHVNYKLHGMEKSNSKALSRQIVLHSWNDISETEVFPAGTPEGWGCPAVSNNFMTRLDKKLKTMDKPVLLWIYK